MDYVRYVVLIANEDSDSRVIYSEYLATCGYRVILATGPEVVHRIAAEQRPDVIIAELLERTQSGWRTPELLKQDQRTSDIPLIAVTSWAMPEDQDRAMLSGCDAILPKPVGPAELAKTIEQFFGR